MKRLLFAILLIFGGIGSSMSQNSLGSTDDMGRIAITPIVIEESGVPVYARKALTSKLKQIVTRNGLGAEPLSPRFVLTASVDLVNKEMTATAPPMTAVEVATTLYIGDAVTGQLFASYAYEPSKGVGTNEKRAYLAALNRVSATSADVAAFVEKGKQKIVEFYNSQIDFLLAEAKALRDREQYDESIAILSGVPSICKEAYTKAMSEVAVTYQRKLDVEGAAAYNKAVAAWNTNKSREGADAAIVHLATIHPMSSYAAKGSELIKSIESHHAAVEARRLEMEERERQYQLQREADEREFQREKMQMEHEVAMKQADNAVMFGRSAIQEMSANGAMAPAAASAASQGGVVNKIASWFM
ncbi:MAG: hypothetical protein IKC42_00960 [Alistipes sp.]|nr:hypothetical protein [Alistipes sp.]